MCLRHGEVDNPFKLSPDNQVRRYTLEGHIQHCPGSTGSQSSEIAPKPEETESLHKSTPRDHAGSTASDNDNRAIGQLEEQLDDLRRRLEKQEAILSRRDVLVQQLTEQLEVFSNSDFHAVKEIVRRDEESRVLRWNIWFDVLSILIFTQSCIKVIF